MDLELVKEKLEVIGTVDLIEVVEGKLNISISDIISSTKTLIDFLGVYYDYIYNHYKAQEALVIDGVTIKAVYSNNPEHMAADEDFVTNITNQ